MHIYADQISQVSLSNGNLRITLTQRGPNNETVEAGTLYYRLTGNVAPKMEVV